MLLDYLIIHYQNFGVKIWDIWGPYFKLGIWFYAAFKFNFKGGGVYYKHSTIINKCVLYRQLHSITDVCQYCRRWSINPSLTIKWIQAFYEQWSPTEPLFHKNKVITSVKHSRMRQKINHPKHLGMDDFDRKVLSGGQCQGDPNVQPAILVLTGGTTAVKRRKYRKLNLLWAMKAHRKGNFYSKYFF